VLLSIRQHIFHLANHAVIVATHHHPTHGQGYAIEAAGGTSEGAEDGIGRAWGGDCVGTEGGSISVTGVTR
jgi:hypothetical protein